MEKSRYWFIEFENGEEAGYESKEPCTEQDVKDYMMSYSGDEVEAYPTTKFELYVSEVDIF